MQQEEKKKLICTLAGRTFKKLRKNKSPYMLALEYEISTSLLNSLERGVKDPQLTTIFKVAEALGVKASEFVKIIEDELPDGFSLVE
ncbi:MAG: helix-turn-helix transcriptional regulator [Candidatus Gastranaerophilales bacterium]|nr:helix-turn-helix transcriptional regulator [Candidatus Gastranaerophilales bacterium]